MPIRGGVRECEIKYLLGVGTVNSHTVIFDLGTLQTTKAGGKLLVVSAK